MKSKLCKLSFMLGFFLLLFNYLIEILDLSSHHFNSHFSVQTIAPWTGFACDYLCNLEYNGMGLQLFIWFLSHNLILPVCTCPCSPSKLQRPSTSSWHLASFSHLNNASCILSSFHTNPPPSPHLHHLQKSPSVFVLIIVRLSLHKTVVI